MIINGKNYKIPEFSFETICDLEDYGVSLTSLTEKPMKTVRAFAALAIGDAKTASREIEEHIKNGGNLTEFVEEIQRSISESGFFQSLVARTETENAASQPETTHEE